MCIFAYLTQLFRTKRIYLCSPALVMPFNYLNVILGLIVDILVFNAHYNWIIVLGMILASAGLLSKFIILKLDSLGKDDKGKGKEIFGDVVVK